MTKESHKNAGDRFCDACHEPVKPAVGFIVAGGSGKASDKMAAMEAAGITVCSTPADIGQKIKERLSS